MKAIRGKAIVILEHGNRFLFTVCYEESANKVFYIPVGGGIEFGEYSFEAAKREAFEETGEEIINLRLIDISENIFTYNGTDEHEIVFVYKADFKNKEAYASSPEGKLNDAGNPIKFTWTSLAEIREHKISVYPFGLLETLERPGASSQ